MKEPVWHKKVTWTWTEAMRHGFKFPDSFSSLDQCSFVTVSKAVVTSTMISTTLEVVLVNLHLVTRQIPQSPVSWAQMLTTLWLQCLFLYLLSIVKLMVDPKRSSGLCFTYKSKFLDAAQVICLTNWHGLYCYTIKAQLRHCPWLNEAQHWFQLWMQCQISDVILFILVSFEWKRKCNPWFNYMIHTQMEYLNFSISANASI